MTERRGSEFSGRFSLAPGLCAEGLRDVFRERGALSISGLVPVAAAEALARELSESQAWLEIFRGEGEVYEMPTAAFDVLDEDRKLNLTRMIQAAARKGLQYRYRAIRTSEQPDERERGGRLLDAFVSFLNSGPVLSLLRRITGIDGIDLADGQATDFRAGDFLTTHNDAIEGKNRLAAYVYGLTPSWRADWGGLLLLEKGAAVEGFVPAFNDLRIFSVPTAHHVSLVAPWVEERRLSVTGWLRASCDRHLGHRGL